MDHPVALDTRSHADVQTDIETKINAQPILIWFTSLLVGLWFTSL